jgi:hypothetical protein
MSGRQIIQLDIARLVHNFSARGIPRRIQVFSNCSLPVRHHHLSGKFFGVDEESLPPFPRDCRSTMRLPFTIHALAEAHRAQQIDGSGLQHSGANPPQHMLAALPFQHHGIDAVPAKSMREKQSSRPSAYDCHLGSHHRFHKQELPTKSSIETDGTRISLQSRMINWIYCFGAIARAS